MARPDDVTLGRYTGAMGFSLDLLLLLLLLLLTELRVLLRPRGRWLATVPELVALFRMRGVLL